MTDLSKYHTKQLLEALDEFRVFNSCKQTGYDVDDFYSGNYNNEVVFGELIVFLNHDEDPVTHQELKAELATREHIPNSVERKELRRQKAKEQRNR